MSKFKPNEEIYDLGALRSLEDRRRTIGGQELNISSPDPIRCSAPQCHKEITGSDAYTIVTTPRGTVIWHLWCLGIMRYGDLNDPAYAALIRQRLQQVIG